MQGLGINSCWAPAPVTRLPPLPEHHVPRPLLASALVSARQRLMLLCAPTGYGKTVLLRESFAVPGGGEQTLWLALKGRAPTLADLCRDIATSLGLPGQTSAAMLLRHFSLGGRPLRLVLDDLSGDLSIEANNWFEQLLSLPESRVRLAVSCRQRPAWDLPRLLLRGELLELGVEHLCMSHLDYQSLCEHIAPGVEESLRKCIEERCGGWWGGACLLLAGGRQGEAMLRDYLEREVLSRLSEGERRLFLGLCNLPRFSGELCAQLWEGHGAAQWMHRLLQLQVFISPLQSDGRWYRVQPLVAGVLQDGADPGELARLRLHACRLLSLAGHLHDAIDQALQAQQPEVAATYMERLKPSWQLADLHLRQVLDWSRQLPADLLQSTPRLVYLSTLALLLSGRVREARQGLECLSRFLPAANAADNHVLLAHWQALQGGLQAFLGESREAERYCRAALAELGWAPTDWLSRLLCYFTLGRVVLAFGRMDEAQDLWRDALEQARRQGCQDSEALLQGERLRALMLTGEPELANLLLNDSLDSRLAMGLERDPVLGRLLLTRAEWLLLKGAVSEAEGVLHAAQQHTRDCSAPFVHIGFLGLAEVAGRRGHLALARAQVHRGERAMHCGLIDKECYRAALELQELKLLAHAADWSAVLQAALHLAGEYPLGGELSTLLPPTLPHEVQWLAAQAEYHLGQTAHSRVRLEALAEHCSDYGFHTLEAEVRGFLGRQGEALKEEREALPDYQEELTAREAAVLELLAEGLSNQGIANALFLSVNTVKYHAKNINSKLGTTRRTQAIACAKARGLLA